MMHVLKAAFPTPNQASLRGTCPLDMMNKMGDAGHIFDATELEIEVPTEKQAQAATWSETSTGTRSSFSRAFLRVEQPSSK
ncbi:hypothetical protein NFJ02_25g57680 [Pycnococcus provasolii]